MLQPALYLANSINYRSILPAVAVLWLIASTLRNHIRLRKLPPGPKGIPLLGNIFQIPTQLPWIRFYEMSKVYGPIISFNVAGHPVIVLNNNKSAFDLLDRRSTIYSHKPRFIMAGDLLSGGIMMSFISYGGLFRRLRRATHDTFGPHGSEQFQPLQEKEAVLLASELTANPDSWEELVKRSTASNILTATYGWPRINDTYMPLVKRIHAHTARLANASIPGSSMVDLFPFLNHLPLWMSAWKSDALEWHKRESEMFESFNAEVEKKMKTGDVKHCFVSDLIENEEKFELSKKEAAWLSGIMFSAGAETTSASIANFLIAMIHHPDIMRKAQAEIDSVIGRDRVPTFADRPHLPYIRALVRELLRWRPAGPLGIPKRAAEDDWYNGYFIPKGATVISNIWAIDRDPSIYSDPESFIPERHLDKTGTKDISPPEMHSLGHVSFGFGRRTCVGVTFASQSLFINFAMLLWAFDIEKACDDQGNELIPSLTDVIDAGVVVGPAPFQCRLTPRYSDINVVLERAKADY